MLYRTSAAAQYRYVYVEYVRPRSTSGRAVHVQYVGVHDLCIDTVSLMLCLHYVGVHSLGLIVCLHAPRPQNHIVIAWPRTPDGSRERITTRSAQVWSANGPNLGTCLTPEVPSAALLSNDELVNAPWPQWGRE